jgi:hypothetical protein
MSRLRYLRYKLGVALLAPWLFAEVRRLNDDCSVPEDLGRLDEIGRLWCGNVYRDRESAGHRRPGA